MSTIQAAPTNPISRLARAIIVRALPWAECSQRLIFGLHEFARPRAFDFIRLGDVVLAAYYDHSFARPEAFPALEDASWVEAKLPGCPLHAPLRELGVGLAGLRGFCRQPGEVLGKPEEIAAMIRLLVSGDGAFTTGQTIHVNGGLYFP